MSVVSWITQWLRWNRWNFTVRLIQGARPRCAVPDYLFAANFGLRCLVPAWKKASLGLDLLSQQLCARSTHNIWLDHGRPLRPSVTIAGRKAHPLLGRIPLSCR